MRADGLANPYLRVHIEPASACTKPKGKTAPVPNTLSPMFDIHFDFKVPTLKDVDLDGTRVHLGIHHLEMKGATPELMGCMSFSLADILDQNSQVKICCPHFTS
jgi:hypothetical protein